MGTPGNRIIGWAAKLVPRKRRDDWRREWEAEAAFAWTQVRRSTAGRRWERTRLRARVMTCVIDATLERLESMNVTGWGQDVRLAMRGLMRKPMFALVAIVTLALGIGASTAVFTLVDGVLLSPLDYAESEELLALRHTARGGEDQLPMSSGLYLLYEEEARTLESVALYSTTAVTIMADGQPERVLGQRVTPSFFSTLGVTAATGRTFTMEESVPGGSEVVLLSDGLWRSRFGGDADILGRTVDMSGTSRTVVGVMPPGFGYPDPSARFWMPLRIDEAQAPLASFFAGGMARLAPGSSLEGARAEIDGLLSRLEALRPGDGAAQFLADVGMQGDIVPLKTALGASHPHSGSSWARLASYSSSPVRTSPTSSSSVRKVARRSWHCA